MKPARRYESMAVTSSYMTMMSQTLPKERRDRRTKKEQDQKKKKQS